MSVRYESQGATALVTFDRPAARNAMTWEMYQELYDACERIDADDTIRVAVLRGAGGKAFVAGTDIGQFREFRTGAEGGADGAAYEQRISEIIDRLEAVKVPTVAVVDGYAVGGGLVIAAACDIRIATPSARFGLPIARTLGNCVSARTCALLVSLIGPARALELIYTAEFVGAERAAEIGLANEVVAPERLDTRLRELCERLSAHAPLTMWAAKETIRRLRADTLPEDDDIIRACYGSADFREGIAAFIDKRTPKWTGR
ncbi:MAG: enoyl-CoA hydratase/isomerase family protein [Actinomadura sp.]